MKLDFGLVVKSAVYSKCELLTFTTLTNQIKMSLSDTSKLIEQSRKIVESSHDDVSTIINMFLQVVTSIDSRMQRIETNIDKKLDELKQSFLAVSSRVRT